MPRTPHNVALHDVRSAVRNRQSSRSINRPSDRKRRRIVLARLLVSCPLLREHRKDDVIDPLAVEPEAPDHVSFLAETQPLHEPVLRGSMEAEMRCFRSFPNR